MEMDVSVNSILRGRSNLTNKSSSRSSLASSSTSSILYYESMEVNNNKPDNNSREPIDNFQLFYMDNANRGKPVSIVADNSSVDRSQCVSNKAPALISSSLTQGQVDNNNRSNSEQQLIFNINLLYDVNQAIDQNL